MAGGQRDAGVSALRCPHRPRRTSRVVDGRSGLPVLPPHRGHTRLPLPSGALAAYTRGDPRASARPRRTALSRHAHHDNRASAPGEVCPFTPCATPSSTSSVHQPASNTPTRSSTTEPHYAVAATVEPHAHRCATALTSPPYPAPTRSPSAPATNSRPQVSASAATHRPGSPRSPPANGASSNTPPPEPPTPDRPSTLHHRQDRRNARPQRLPQTQHHLPPPTRRTPHRHHAPVAAHSQGFGPRPR